MLTLLIGPYRLNLSSISRLSHISTMPSDGAREADPAPQSKARGREVCWPSITESLDLIDEPYRRVQGFVELRAGRERVDRDDKAPAEVDVRVLCIFNNRANPCWCR